MGSYDKSRSGLPWIIFALIYLRFSLKKHFNNELSKQKFFRKKKLSLIKDENDNFVSARDIPRYSEFRTHPPMEKMRPSDFTYVVKMLRAEATDKSKESHFLIVQPSV